MISTIKYADLKGSGDKEFKVVTFEDGTKASAWKRDRDGNTCPYWDDLAIGVTGEYKTRKNGDYNNLTGFTPTSAPARSDSPQATPSTGQTGRERSIQMQTCMKVAAMASGGKKTKEAIFEDAEFFYLQLTGEAFNDPFED